MPRSGIASGCLEAPISEMKPFFVSNSPGAASPCKQKLLLLLNCSRLLASGY